MTRDDALALLGDWVPNKNLQKHMFAVESAMAAYAEKEGEDIESWSLAGLLHDADWEKWPEEHPLKIVEELRKLGVNEQVVNAIANHGGKGAGARTTRIAKCLFACDELTGLIVATALMYPNKLADVTSEKVMKKFKTPGFARGVNREEVSLGAEEFGVDLLNHIDFVLKAMLKEQNRLGL